MKFEHFALNVPEPIEQARWYVRHLHFQIVRAGEEPPFAHFLADQTGRVVVELYRNPASPIPDYHAMHPLSFHFAMVATDAAAERARLEVAGATLLSEDTVPDGSVIVMMRDPWGLPLQLCQRAEPFPMPTQQHS